MRSGGATCPPGQLCTWLLVASRLLALPPWTCLLSQLSTRPNRPPFTWERTRSLRLLADSTIVVGKQALPVHSHVLAGQSRVLRSAFYMQSGGELGGGTAKVHGLMGGRGRSSPRAEA